MAEYSVLIRASCVLIGLTVILSPGLAQTRDQGEANLRVIVVDPRGAALVGANVRITSVMPEVVLVTDGRGEALFTRLPAGPYRLLVEAGGFEPREVSEQTLRPGNNRLEIRLNVAGVKEELEVKQDEREKMTDPRGSAFTNVLTQEQIDALPDDPDEFEAAIRNIGGAGATLRVNGFRGGRLPPKSQIREIRYRMNPYAAENHETGFMSIDIITKPGVDNWHGSFSFGFRDEALNARNAFARVLGPEQLRRFGATLDGPIWKNRTSLALSADGTSSFDSKTIVAALPEGSISDLIRRPSRLLNLTARVDHVLDKTHTLRAEYQRNALRQDNLGVGDFDLPERAYSTDRVEHILRFSDSGMLTSRLINEFRFQTRWQQTDSRSAFDSPAVLVLNAFHRGGAGIASDRRLREIELANNVDFALEKHSMRVGFLFEAGSYDSRELRNGNGTFVFASLNDFLEGRPTTFTRRGGDPTVRFTQYEFGWYWQDDIRLRSNLSLSVGLRHEFQTHLPDANNFAPRFGMSWSPFKDGKTTLRAGAGLFYDWFTSDTFEQTLRVDGVRQSEVVVTSPGFPDPFIGGTPIVFPPGRIQRDPLLEMPYVQQVSLGVQRQLAPTIRLQANYFYQRGVHQLRGHNINAVIPGVGRPDPQSGNVTQVESTANLSRHALNVNLSFQNMKRRLFGHVGYFLSRVTNESDGALSLPANNFDFRAERGPAPGDARHRVFAMLNMELLWGLRIGAQFNASSAMPYNITTGFDDNGDSVSNDRPRGVTRNSARGKGHWNVNTRLSWGFGFGKSNASAVQSRRAVIVRSGENSDLLGSVPSMTGAARNRWRMELYAQAFNLFNHTNLFNFSGVQTSPFFGQATAALPGRRIETGLRFSF